MKPILVNADTAAEALGISRSQFDAKVRQGVLPAPIRVLGPPLWVRKELKDAVDAMAITSPTADGTVPAVPAPLPKPVKKDWSPD